MSPRRQGRVSSTGAGGSAGRIIAGSARGIRLMAPGEGTRPLGDRVKQALFAILESQIRGRAFLDLYAGSGAAGIEALSRGASKAVFVERDTTAVAIIQRNLAAAGIAGPTAVVHNGLVTTWLAFEQGLAEREDPKAQGPFAIVVADPPYDDLDELNRALKRIANAGPGAILAADGVMVVKYFWKTAPAESPLLRSVRQERFGETMLAFYRWAEEETR